MIHGESFSPFISGTFSYLSSDFLVLRKFHIKIFHLTFFGSSGFFMGTPNILCFIVTP